MKTMMTVFAFAAMFGSTVQATTNDSMAEERFKVKYGRYSPTEERRQKFFSEAKVTMADCEGMSCCRHMPATTMTVTRSLGSAVSDGAAARLQVKLGLTPRSVSIAAVPVSGEHACGTAE